MRFSVIYSADVPEDISVRRFAPPRCRAWTQTEAGRTEYGDLGGVWKRGKHRKWAGLLTKAQFLRFVQDARLCAENCETGGSLGAPGFGFGWAPAISFSSDEQDAIQSAYVTPLPEPVRGRPPYDDREWQRLRKRVIQIFG